MGPYPSSSSCEAVNARAFHGKGYCRCTTSGSSGGGGNNWRAEQLRREYLRKQREEERKRRLLQEADAENEQRRQAAQAEFMDKHTEATQKLKGARPDKLTLKSGTNFFNSNAQRHQGTMDYQKSLELSSKQLEIRATASEWKQIYCGMWIANYANPAAREGDVAEVRFLKSQMMQCFKGGLVELRCPSAAEVPAIPGGVEIGGDTPLALFYQKLMQATEREARVVQRSNKFLFKAKAQKKELQSKTAQKKKEVDQWEAKLKKLQPKPSEQPEKKTSQSDGEEAKKRALAEAMAALKAAKAALAGAEMAEKKMVESIRKAEKDINQANGKLDRYGKMAKEVQARPDQATKIAQKIAK